MGPFKAAGKVFNTVGTAIDVVDVTTTRTKDLIITGFDMIDEAIADAREEMETDKIVAQAKQQVARQKALAEAAVIIASLPQVATATTAP